LPLLKFQYSYVVSFETYCVFRITGLVDFVHYLVFRTERRVSSFASKRWVGASTEWFSVWRAIINQCRL